MLPTREAETLGLFFLLTNFSWFLSYAHLACDAACLLNGLQPIQTHAAWLTQPHVENKFYTCCCKLTSHGKKYSQVS